MRRNRTRKGPPPQKNSKRIEEMRKSFKRVLEVPKLSKTTLDWEIPEDESIVHNGSSVAKGNQAQLQSDEKPAGSS